MAENAIPPGEVRDELERIAFGEATSGRAQLAKVTALRTLGKPPRWRRGDPIPPMPDDWYGDPDDPFYDLDLSDMLADRRQGPRHGRAQPGPTGLRQRMWELHWKQKHGRRF
jgi:hypothetical protein